MACPWLQIFFPPPQPNLITNIFLHLITQALRFVRICDAQAARARFCSQLDCASTLLGKVSSQLKFTPVVPVTKPRRLLTGSSAQLSALADCWFMQLFRQSEGSLPRESIPEAAGHRNLPAHLLPEILIPTITNYISFSYRLTFCFFPMLSWASAMICFLF